ncbi:MAG: hypothetical protein LBM09_00635 [Candidatus Nomurabacteria bacterium]|jgi:hypothetical protein|nr:hypothetical protein [Candidatus Nomurabacteria bacterium]
MNPEQPNQPSQSEQPNLPTEPVLQVNPAMQSPAQPIQPAPQPMQQNFAQPASMPMIQQNPQMQPIGGAPLPPVANKPKSKKGLIIGLIVGGVLLIGITLLILFLFVFNGGDTIKSADEFRDAVRNKKAVNCEVDIKNIANASGGFELAEGSKATIQANDGWSKVRMNVDLGIMKVNVLMIEGDAAYAWYGTTGTKIPYDASQIGETAEGMDEADFEVNCKPNSEADFSKPSNIDWVDSSSVLQNFTTNTETNLDLDDFDVSDYSGSSAEKSTCLLGGGDWNESVSKCEYDSSDYDYDFDESDYDYDIDMSDYDFDSSDYDLDSFDYDFDF